MQIFKKIKYKGEKINYYVNSQEVFVNYEIGGYQKSLILEYKNGILQINKKWNKVEKKIIKTREEHYLKLHHFFSLNISEYEFAIKQVEHGTVLLFVEVNHTQFEFITSMNSNHVYIMDDETKLDFIVTGEVISKMKKKLFQSDNKLRLHSLFL
jgi:hypothetical protein